MSSPPVSLSLSLSHPVGETVLSHARTSGGELCRWFVLALCGRNKDGNTDRSEPIWAAEPPLLWSSGSCLLCSILAGCSAVTCAPTKLPMASLKWERSLLGTRLIEKQSPEYRQSRQHGGRYSQCGGWRSRGEMQLSLNETCGWSCQGQENNWSSYLGQNQLSHSPCLERAK